MSQTAIETRLFKPQELWLLWQAASAECAAHNSSKLSSQPSIEFAIFGVLDRSKTILTPPKILALKRQNTAIFAALFLRAAYDTGDVGTYYIVNIHKNTCNLCLYGRSTDGLLSLTTSDSIVKQATRTIPSVLHYIAEERDVTFPEISSKELQLVLRKLLARSIVFLQCIHGTVPINGRQATVLTFYDLLDNLETEKGKEDLYV